MTHLKSRVQHQCENIEDPYDGGASLKNRWGLEHYIPNAINIGTSSDERTLSDVYPRNMTIKIKIGFRDSSNTDYWKKPNRLQELMVYVYHWIAPQGFLEDGGSKAAFRNQPGSLAAVEQEYGIHKLLDIADVSTSSYQDWDLLLPNLNSSSYFHILNREKVSIASDSSTPTVWTKNYFYNLRPQEDVIHFRNDGDQSHTSGWAVGVYRITPDDTGGSVEAKPRVCITSHFRYFDNPDFEGGRVTQRAKRRKA